MYTTPQGSKQSRYQSEEDGDLDQDYTTYSATRHTLGYGPYPTSQPNDVGYEEPEPYHLEEGMQQMSLQTPRSYGAEYPEADTEDASAADYAFHPLQQEYAAAMSTERYDASNSYVLTTQPTMACNWPHCSQRFSSAQERDRHYRTVHANNGERPYKCTFSGCPAGVTSWTRADKLKEHNNTWHGPYACPLSCSRGFPHGFKSQALLDDHIASAHQGQTNGDSLYSGPTVTDDGLSYATAGSSSQQMQMQIQTTQDLIEPTRITAVHGDKVDKLHPEFKVQKSQLWTWGKVFKTLWTEPKGSSVGDSGTETSVTTVKHREHYEKVRRFVIVDTRRGHSICLAIHTYSRQGTMKKGVHASDHAAIYTVGKQPKLLHGERSKGLTRKPIAIKLTHSWEKLDPSTRLNYAKLYTVEHNVRVVFIGTIHQDSQWQLTTDYNSVHPPIAPPAISSAYDSGYAQQDSYPTQNPSNSLLYDTGGESSAGYGYSTSSDSYGAIQGNSTGYDATGYPSSQLYQSSQYTPAGPFAGSSIPDTQQAYGTPYTVVPTISYSINSYDSEPRDFPSTQVYPQSTSATGVEYGYPSATDAYSTPDYYNGQGQQTYQQYMPTYSNDEDRARKKTGDKGDKGKGKHRSHRK